MRHDSRVRMQTFAFKIACDDDSSSKIAWHAWLSPMQLSLQVAQLMKHDLMEALDAMKKLSPLLLAGAGQASCTSVSLSAKLF